MSLCNQGVGGGTLGLSLVFRSGVGNLGLLLRLLPTLLVVLLSTSLGPVQDPVQVSIESDRGLLVAGRRLFRRRKRRRNYLLSSRYPRKRHRVLVLLDLNLGWLLAAVCGDLVVLYYGGDLLLLLLLLLLLWLLNGNYSNFSHGHHVKNVSGF